jgi:hypothetical protein
VNSAEIIMAALAGLSAFAACVSSIAVLRVRASVMWASEKELRIELKELLEALHHMETLLQSFTKEQAVINKFAADMNDRLTTRVEWLEQVSLKMQRQAGMTD